MDVMRLAKKVANKMCQRKKKASDIKLRIEIKKIRENKKENETTKKTCYLKQNKPEKAETFRMNKINGN